MSGNVKFELNDSDVDVDQSPTGEDDDGNGNGNGDNTDSSNIDSDIRRTVFQNEQLRDWIRSLQTTSLTESIRITPTGWMCIHALLFIIPCVWSIYNLTNGGGVPSKIFYDYCVDTDPATSNVSFNMSYCLRCANDRGYLWAGGRAEHIGHLQELPAYVTHWRTVAITYSVCVPLLAFPTYARLVLTEKVATHLLVHGIVLKKKFSFGQLLPVFVFTVLFMLVGVFNMVARSKLVRLYDGSDGIGIILGYGDRCGPVWTTGSEDADNWPTFPSEWAALDGRVLRAGFNADNPSFSAAAIPTTVIGVLRTLVIVFLPFLPLVRLIYISSASTFSKLTVNHLLKDKKNAEKVLQQLQWQVRPTELHDALVELGDDPAVGGPQEKNFWSVARHLLLCTCVWSRPLPQTFGLVWGVDTGGGGGGGGARAVRKLCMILRRRGALEEYTLVSKKKILFKKLDSALGAGQEMMSRVRGGAAGSAGNSPKNQQQQHSVSHEDSGVLEAEKHLL